MISVTRRRSVTIAMQMITLLAGLDIPTNDRAIFRSSVRGAIVVAQNYTGNWQFVSTADSRRIRLRNRELGELRVNMSFTKLSSEETDTSR